MASAAESSTPLPNAVFPHAARIPYAFAQAQGVLPGADEGVAVIVYTRPNASADGLSEVRRILARPIRAEPVGAERFAVLLARAYNQASPVAGAPATPITCFNAGNCRRICARLGNEAGSTKTAAVSLFASRYSSASGPNSTDSGIATTPI